MNISDKDLSDWTVKEMEDRCASLENEDWFVCSHQKSVFMKELARRLQVANDALEISNRRLQVTNETLEKINEVSKKMLKFNDPLYADETKKEE